MKQAMFCIFGISGIQINMTVCIVLKHNSETVLNDNFPSRISPGNHSRQYDSITEEFRTKWNFVHSVNFSQLKNDNTFPSSDKKEQPLLVFCLWTSPKQWNIHPLHNHQGIFRLKGWDVHKMLTSVANRSAVHLDWHGMTILTGYSTVCGHIVIICFLLWI